MSYGFARASTSNVCYQLIAAADIDEHANATYEAMLGLRPEHFDVRELEGKGALDDFLRSSGRDPSLPMVLIGCSPCQGFSSHRKKDPREDVRDSLLEAFGRLAAAMRPAIVVMENVPEILSHKHWDHFSAWRRSLEQVGYKIRVKIFNLAGFGVPQERFRAVAIAARDWRYFGMPKATLHPSEYHTVRSAIGHLEPLEAGGKSERDPMHLTSRHRTETVDLMRLIPPDGGSRRALPSDVGPRCLQKVDGFRDVYGRLFWDKPAVAITARCRTPSCGRFVHPEQHRGLSVREAALLQGFPPEYLFEGPFDDKFKQIGNAVSPTFADAVARHLDRQWIVDHDDPAADTGAEGDISMPIQKSISSSLAAIKRGRQPGLEHRSSIAIA